MPGAALPVGEHVAVTEQFSAPYSARLAVLQCVFEAGLTDGTLHADALGLGNRTGCLGVEEAGGDTRAPAGGLQAARSRLGPLNPLVPSKAKFFSRALAAAAA